VMRLGGNRALYQRLLCLFQKEHAGDSQKLRDALQNNDLELAQRQAHSLKGVAGTIGAEELRVSAKQLESAIAEGNLQLALNVYLDDVAQNLTIVLASIATFDQSNSSPQ
jgi:two-component system sensor histidine kinase/response regulator